MTQVVTHTAHDSLHEPESDPMCSSRRCTARGVWALRWNNPRLHTPERRKTWLACDEHRDHLESFLSSRGYLREVEALVASAERSFLRI